MWVSYSIGMIWAVIGSREVKWTGRVLEHEVSTKSWGDTNNERELRNWRHWSYYGKNIKKEEWRQVQDLGT